MHTTLNKILKHDPCARCWDTLLAHLGKIEPDDEPLPILTILDSNGFDDALWALRAVDGHEKAIRAFSWWCVARVRHLIRDPALSYALATVERYAHGLATEEERARAQLYAQDIYYPRGLCGQDDRIAEAVWFAAMGKEYRKYVVNLASTTALALSFSKKDAALVLDLLGENSDLVFDFSGERAAQEAELRRILNA